MNHFVFGSNGMMGKYFCSMSKHVVVFTRKDYDIRENNIEILKNKGVKDGDVLLNFAGAVKQRKFSISDYVYINSLFPHQLEEVSKKLKCKFIHLTTDCVYDGLLGSYKEDHEHTCVDWYGNSKSLGEPQQSCCIRTSIIGLKSAGNVSLLDWFYNCQDEQIKGFSNHFWNGVTCLELSNIILQIIKENSFWIGSRHIFSNSVSKYELLKMYNEIFNLNKNLICSYSKNKCDRTLASNFNDTIPKTIYTQLQELKKYHE